MAPVGGRSLRTRPQSNSGDNLTTNRAASQSSKEKENIPIVANRPKRAAASKVAPLPQKNAARRDSTSDSPTSPSSGSDYGADTKRELRARGAASQKTVEAIKREMPSAVVSRVTSTIVKSRATAAPPAATKRPRDNLSDVEDPFELSTEDLGGVLNTKRQRKDAKRASASAKASTPVKRGSVRNASASLSMLDTPSNTSFTASLPTGSPFQSTPSAGASSGAGSSSLDALLSPSLDPIPRRTPHSERPFNGNSSVLPAVSAKADPDTQASFVSAAGSDAGAVRDSMCSERGGFKKRSRTEAKKEMNAQLETQLADMRTHFAEVDDFVLEEE